MTSAVPNPIPFAGCLSTEPAVLDSTPIVLLGLPDDSRSSFRSGAAAAPAAVREAYDGRCYNASCETGLDLSGRVGDLGDVAPGANWKETRRRFETRARDLFASGRTPFFVGGDHAVTLPVVEGLESIGEPVHIVQLDAHPDLYDVFEGDPQSHACVAARLLELEHVATLTQLGVRTLNGPQSRVAERYRDRLRIFGARELGSGLLELRHLPSDALVYLSVDMDVFDPAFAPGVSHPVPGGLTPRQVLDLIQNGSWRLAGMDVVETNPGRDFSNLTTILAGRLLHEGMGRAFVERADMNAVE